MQANFSAAYDCYSLKTISDFIIKHITIKAYKRQKSPVDNCRQGIQLIFTFTLRL